jgi:hypothetical protein
MSRPSRYLTRMTLFIIAVLLVAAMLAPGLASAFMSNPVLNGVIVLVALVGAGYTFRSVLILRPEIAWLEAYQVQRTGRGKQSGVPQPQLLAPLAKMLGERQGRLTMSAMAMRSVLDGIGARLGEAREIARYVIGLLVFLGLLGTFWGLLQTIGAVASVVSGLNVQGDMGMVFNDLKAGLQAPLQGMGTAFSSSLFGLAGSLSLGFLELQASQAQNRFYNDLEDWLAGTARLTGAGPITEGETSVPAYLQGLLEQTAENLDTLQRTIAHGEDGRRQANHSLMQLTDKLSILTDQMRTEQTLMVKLAESQLELKPVLTRLAEAASHSGFGTDDSTRQHIRNIDLYLHRLYDDLPASRDQVVGEIRSEIKLLARTIAALAEEPESR